MHTNTSAVQHPFTTAEQAAIESLRGRLARRLSAPAVAIEQGTTDDGTEVYAGLHAPGFDALATIVKRVDAGMAVLAIMDGRGSIAAGTRASADIRDLMPAAERIAAHAFEADAWHRGA